MKALGYGIYLQWKMDIRSRSLLITCYLVPLLFFLMMGSVFTSIMPESQETLMASMTVMGVSMGAYIGLPPSIAEIYGTDIKKMYMANHIPEYFAVLSLFLSAFIHLMIMSGLIYILSPLLFDATCPIHSVLYFVMLILFVLVSLSIACILGLAVHNQAKLTMVSQIIFLPSIILSGIMFPVSLLPSFLETIGKLCPATWGYLLLIEQPIQLSNVYILCMILIVALVICYALLRSIRFSFRHLP